MNGIWRALLLKSVHDFQVLITLFKEFSIKLWSGIWISWPKWSLGFISISFWKINGRELINLDERRPKEDDDHDDIDDGSETMQKLDTKSLCLLPFKL
jgi:hypothetical protein